MQATTSAVRAHRRMMDSIDAAPPDRLTVVFCPEWHAAAMSDYCNDCRANPEVQLPPFEEYAVDWLAARLADEAAQADAEAAQQRTAEREQRQFPGPVYGDDEIPF